MWFLRLLVASPSPTPPYMLECCRHMGTAGFVSHLQISISQNFFDSDPEVRRRWHQQSAMMNLPYSLVDGLVFDFKWNICGIFVWCFNGKLSKIYASQPRRHWNRKDLGSSTCWPAFGPWGTNQPSNQCGHATSSNGAEFQVAEVLVYNFNEQSESTELIGGFRPVACDSGGILSTIFQINLDSRCFQNILFLWFQGQCHAVNVWACLDLGAPKFIAGSCGGREKRQVFFLCEV